MNGPLAYAEEHGARFVSELMPLLRFPTIASEPLHARDLVHCATWLANHLREIGLRRTRLVDGGRAPFVLAEWMEQPSAPTVLIYGHYDVQPAQSSAGEPWQSSPFDPTVRGDNLYARGASDDKGQMFIHVKAIESWLRSCGRLPVNIKCVFDGEEEIGSPGLAALIAARRADLSADIAVISDMPMLGPGLPAITYGMRGALNVDIEVWRHGSELHSGLFGGAAANPLEMLCALVASLRGADGAVAIPGFYDDVCDVPPDERAYLRAHRLPKVTVPALGGGGALAGERRFSAGERATIRPAMTVNALQGGYAGAGTKASIPNRARAKLDIRLMPHQDPLRIERELRRFLGGRVPSGARWRMRRRAAVRPFLLDREHPALAAASSACRQGFGVDASFCRSGGSLPAATLFKEKLGVPVVLMGFALPDDRAHGADEKLHLPTFHRGIATVIAFLAESSQRLAQPQIVRGKS